MKKLFFFIVLLSNLFFLNSEEWKTSISKDYIRITDSIVEDIDKDGLDEIIISYYSFGGKKIDIYQVEKGNLQLVNTMVAPARTIFFDAGDIDNDGHYDIVFLTSSGLYYKSVFDQSGDFHIVTSVFSEIVVPQPELLTDVNLVNDLNGDGKNELIIENIRAIEIFETQKFTRLASINLETTLELSMVPGQFYPQYIFYTLPIILVLDMDGDNKKEIITKFPQAIHIYSQKNLNQWELKNYIRIGSDNVYFLSNSFVKFSFPVINDIDNDNIREVVVSSANLDMPRIRFDAIGDVYYFKKGTFQMNKNKQILIKGIPLNLPYFFNINDKKYKDFIIPYVPFNLISLFALMSGGGSVNVPFMYYQQTNDKFDMNKGKKLFEIPFRIENITSFIEELPFDQYAVNQFPDFYYFVHNFKNKTVDILIYNFDTNKNAYQQSIVGTLSIPGYTPELPATLKLGNFTRTSKKDILYFIHKNLFILTRS